MYVITRSSPLSRQLRADGQRRRRNHSRMTPDVLEIGTFRIVSQAGTWPPRVAARDAPQPAHLASGSYCHAMEAAPTVLVSSRQSFLAFPEFCGVVCAIAIASVLLRGIPDDTSTRVVTALFAAGAVGCLVLVLRWRHRQPAKLSVGEDAIVMHGFDGGERTIPRRSDSRLRITSTSAGMIGGVSQYVTVLYDEAVGQPHISVDIYGVERVQQACKTHGWPMAE